ncbi:DUF1571 domain-containing protein [soil metagenome]
MEENRPTIGKSRRLWVPASILVALLGFLSVLAGASWWFTAPLERSPTSLANAPYPSGRGGPTLDRPGRTETTAPNVQWPEARLEGVPAKQLLLDELIRAARLLDQVDGYTATLHRQERIDDTLNAEQVLTIKVRHHPFAVYLKFQVPDNGKEALYVEGQHDNKVIANLGGVARRLVPRLPLDPEGPLALSENRHPITEAGLANLIHKLIRYRKLDLLDPLAETILDQIEDEQGRRWYRSLHTHPRQTDERPFARVEVLYCPRTKLPLHIRNYDWPESGTYEEGQPVQLAERYHYEDLNLDSSLSAQDFDASNPDYSFRRY